MEETVNTTDLFCDRTVTQNILHVQLNHAGITKCESPWVVQLKQGLAFIENLWNDLMIAAGHARCEAWQMSHI